MKVAHTAIMMILGIVLPLMVQLWDRRRLSTEQRSHLWNFASWGAALYAFGPASMLGWIFVTRARWWRILIAPLWTVPLIFLLWLADGLLSWLLEHEPLEADPGELAVAALVAAAATSFIMLVVEIIVWIRGTLRARADRPSAG
ncbi:MAG: hypothetical protein JRI68_27390 [Deltaproteobacteria bacterium]|nr:hypothetical protein [Deltaproteobacteria bacterium]